MTERWLENISGPHQNQTVHTAGSPLDQATGAVIMIHGRGATALSILDLANLLPQQGISYIAPQAHGGSWYPYRFLEPRQLNEPGLSSAHEAVDTLIRRLQQHGTESGRIVLLGFSQGACLATDYAALNPQLYGGIIGLSGGLIGDSIDPENYCGSLDSTPVFLGCSDIDPHIPVERVHETSRVLEALNADVTTSIYRGMGHTINPNEIEHASRIIRDMASA